jgi:Secretion system C-terminal sorting domain
MTKMKYLPIIIAFLNTNLLGSQVNSALGRFTATEVNDLVLLQWEMNSGNVCQGIEIFRSEDSLDFVHIGHISGICGSISEPVPFEYTDLSPVVNKKSYYKIQLGLLGSSQIISTYVSKPGVDGFLLKPNPVNDIATIEFNNDNGGLTNLKLFDIKRNLILEKETRSQSIILDLGLYDAGLYLFTINKESGEVIKGKILVVH